MRLPVDLFDAIETGDLWPSTPVALALGVTRQLYNRLGFTAIGTSMIRRLPAVWAKSRLKGFSSLYG
jgi:hypothetical protein